MAVLDVLVMLLVANGAPIIARHIFGKRLQRPLDGGLRLSDGKPLLGPSKTFRGLFAALALTAMTAVLLGFSPQLGVLVGAAAMTGDLLSSYFKRRRGMPSSSYAPGVDQIPEALLPSLLLMPVLGLTLAEVILIVAAFVALELALSRVLYKLKLRGQPY